MRLSLTPRTAPIAGLLLLGAALVLAGLARDPGAPAPAEPGPTASVRATEARSKATLRPSRRPTSKWERDLDRLSLREVRNLLPTHAPAGYLVVANREDWERTRLLFRRYGELGGEHALDELASRYGRSRYTVDAMTEAIIGWMAVDRDAALAALDSLMRANSGAPIEIGMSWKGTLLLSGLG